MVVNTWSWTVLNIAIIAEPRIKGVVVHVEGDASLVEMPIFERSTIKLAAQRPLGLVYDLSALTFVASLAMGEMIRLAHSIKEFGGRVVIAAPSEMVRGALERARLDRVMPIYSTCEEAVASIEMAQTEGVA